MLSLSFSVFSWSFSWKVFLAKVWKWTRNLVLTFLLLFFFYRVLFYFKKVPNVWCSCTPITSSAMLTVSAAFALLFSPPHLIQRSEMSWESANQMSRHFGAECQKQKKLPTSLMLLWYYITQVLHLIIIWYLATFLYYKSDITQWFWVKLSRRNWLRLLVLDTCQNGNHTPYSSMKEDNLLKKQKKQQKPPKLIRRRKPSIEVKTICCNGV